uniref:Uncharacterized protein n=1 Tax=Spilarctia obliqua nucleopolyhedrovirus TaxID=1638618 RepID=A0A7G9U8E6_9ABAC|nr:hypothetical protein [Spilarctia obliqua nucleopolyhedrovirus]
MNLYLLLGALAVFSLVYDKKENGIVFYLLILVLVFVLISPALISKIRSRPQTTCPAIKLKACAKS